RTAIERTSPPQMGSIRQGEAGASAPRADDARRRSEVRSSSEARRPIEAGGYHPRRRGSPERSGEGERQGAERAAEAPGGGAVEELHPLLPRRQPGAGEGAVGRHPRNGHAAREEAPAPVLEDAAGEQPALGEGGPRRNAGRFLGLDRQAGGARVPRLPDPGGSPLLGRRNGDQGARREVRVAGQEVDP